MKCNYLGFVVLSMLVLVPSSTFANMNGGLHISPAAIFITLLILLSIAALFIGNIVIYITNLQKRKRGKAIITAILSSIVSVVSGWCIVHLHPMSLIFALLCIGHIVATIHSISIAKNPGLNVHIKTGSNE